jgi:uncharacterized membrane protein HdeD (DUF308 family)
MADVYGESYGSTADPNVASRRATYQAAEEGTGWVTFAGIMLAIVGVLNIIYGIAAIADSHFYIRDTSYIVSGLNGWGWALLIVGIIQFFAAFSIWARNEWGRWVGLASAGVNSIIQLMVLPAAPFSSLALFSIDILIIYGLAAYGGRQVA